MLPPQPGRRLRLRRRRSDRSERRRPETRSWRSGEVGLLGPRHPSVRQPQIVPSRDDVLLHFEPLLLPKSLLVPRDEHPPPRHRQPSLYLRLEQSFSQVKMYLFAFLIILSTFSKEQGVTFLAICILYDALKPRGSSTDANNNDRTVSKVGKSTFFCLLFLPSLCLFRLWINGFESPRFSALDNPAAFHEHIVIRVMNYLYQYLINIWLLIFPRDLCFDYSMGCISLITSLWDPRLLFFTGYIVLALFVFSLKNALPREEHLLALLSLGWIVLSFLPASNIVSVGFVIAERVLYVPSMGYCILVGTLLHRLESRVRSPKVLQLATILCLLMTSKCVSRSLEWRTEKDLFASGLSVCPNNAKIHYNLGKVMADGGDFASAEKNYRNAIRLRPDYEQALNNMANLFERRGDNARAIDLLEKSVTANGQFATAWMNLGVNQMAVGEYGRAERSLTNALRLRPRYADAFFNLGNVYLKQRRFTEAERCWRNATIIQPKHERSWTNLLVVLDEQNECYDVEKLARVALAQSLSNDRPIRFQQALCQAKLHKYTEAERNLLALVEEEPENALYAMNLGVLYERWKKPQKAIEVYRRASELSPKTGKVEERLRMLQDKMLL
uniref:dolichyl-phosphate-mannose--protein mannosyltransferase n=1 Tax=Steinernema glaseri TaxID=37863 RepID=A0A1I7ZBW8_9BILA